VNPQLDLLFAALGQQIAGLSTEMAALAAAVRDTGAQSGQGGGARGVPTARDPANYATASAAAGTARVFTVFAAKLAVIFGPLAALGTVLSQTASGAGVFQKSIQVLGATLAPILLPVFTLLAAAILTASDEIWKQLVPNLKRWYAWVAEEGIPKMVEFVEWVSKAAKSALEFAEWAGRKKDTIADVAGGLDTAGDLMNPGKWLNLLGEGIALGGGTGPVADMSDWGGRKGREIDESLGLPTIDTNPFTGNDISGQGGVGGLLGAIRGLDLGGRIDDMRGGFAGGAAGGIGAIGGAPGGGKMEPEPAAPPEKTPADRKADLIRNAQLVVQSMRMSMGSQASIGGVADLQNKAQMAALNVDPLQQKVLQRSLTAFDEMIKALSGIEKNTEKKPAPNHPGRKWAPGEWDTSGDF